MLKHKIFMATLIGFGFLLGVISGAILLQRGVANGSEVFGW